MPDDHGEISIFPCLDGSPPGDHTPSMTTKNLDTLKKVPNSNSSRACFIHLKLEFDIVLGPFYWRVLRMLSPLMVPFVQWEALKLGRWRCTSCAACNGKRSKWVWSPTVPGLNRKTKDFRNIWKGYPACVRNSLILMKKIDADDRNT